jgi:glycosyltransferase involved in cell wall biosynthesis
MPDRINVLFLHSQAGFGADSVIHAHLASSLDRERFSVHVACTAGDGTGTPASLERFEKIPGIRLRPTHFVPGIRRRSAATLLKSLGAAALSPLDLKSLKDYVTKERIQLIHGTDRPRDSVYAVTLGRLTGAKSIVHIHVKWSEEYSAPAKWAVRRADAVFSISRYVTRTIIDMGTPPGRIHTVPNCVEPAAWNPATDGSGIRREFDIAPDAPLLVSVSRLFSWKGQRELIRALALVAKQFPAVRLLIVGADERHVHGGSFTEELQERARELGIAERVTFTGQRSDIPEFMAACDVFSLPSFEEPFGLVFLEAMAMERPVVAINNGGTPEVVEHGRSGLLSEPWDIEGLAANIATLLRDRDLRTRMGRYGRSRVLDYFNAERMARDAARSYRAILGLPPEDAAQPSVV